MNYFNMDKIENKNNIYIKFMLCNLGEKNCLAYTKTQIYIMEVAMKHAATKYRYIL